MPDPIETEQNLEVEDDVQTDQDVKIEDAEVKDDETKETNETRVGVIEKIKNIIRGNADSAEDSDDKEGAGIPDKFTEAALAAGWTEEQIQDWASDYTDDELLEYAKDLTQPSENSDESEQLSKKEGDTQQKVEKKDDKVKESEKDELIAKLTERIDKLEKGQEKNIEQESQKELASMASRVNQVLDEQSKEFEIFGTFDTLPRFPDGRIAPSSPQCKARNEVWGLAFDLHKKAGMDFEEALSTSLNAFKGKNLAKDVKRNLIKDLKKGEKRLSPKHSSHEQVKTDLSGPDVIREVGKKHGLEIR